tara:strand:- start:1017 stop:1184 length:168 start_codon:yes stop_codon:yes gene_type:complete
VKIILWFVFYYEATKCLCTARADPLNSLLFELNGTGGGKKGKMRHSLKANAAKGD